MSSVTSGVVLENRDNLVQSFAMAFAKLVFPEVGSF